MFYLNFHWIPGGLLSLLLFLSWHSSWVVQFPWAFRVFVVVVSVLIIFSSIPWFSDWYSGLFQFFVSLETCFTTQYMINFCRMFREVLSCSIYSFIFWWNVLQTSVRFIWFLMSFSYIVLFSVCKGNLSFGGSGVLKAPIVYVWVPMCNLYFNNFIFTYVGVLKFMTYIRNRYVIFMEFPLLSIKCPSPSTLIYLSLNPILFIIRITNNLLLGSIWLKNIFPNLYSQVIFVFNVEVGMFLVGNRRINTIYIYILLTYVFFLMKWVHWYWEV